MSENSSTDSSYLESSETMDLQDILKKKSAEIIAEKARVKKYIRERIYGEKIDPCEDMK